MRSCARPSCDSRLRRFWRLVSLCVSSGTLVRSWTRLDRRAELVGIRHAPKQARAARAQRSCTRLQRVRQRQMRSSRWPRLSPSGLPLCLTACARALRTSSQARWPRANARQGMQVCSSSALIRARYVVSLVIPQMAPRRGRTHARALACLPPPRPPRPRVRRRSLDSISCGGTHCSPRMRRARRGNHQRSRQEPPLVGRTAWARTLAWPRLPQPPLHWHSPPVWQSRSKYPSRPNEWNRWLRRERCGLRWWLRHRPRCSPHPCWILSPSGAKRSPQRCAQWHGPCGSCPRRWRLSVQCTCARPVTRSTHLRLRNFLTASPSPRLSTTRAR
mmetsp:Transcript_11988/g.50442  ORF Transcript_11988/g.50442 Transcript_11988/m.50442 type:complete len:331 (+) Transcript_11988:1656-2648(+)